MVSQGFYRMGSDLFKRQVFPKLCMSGSPYGVYTPVDLSVGLSAVHVYSFTCVVLWAYDMERVPGQPGLLHRETLSQLSSKEFKNAHLF